MRNLAGILTWKGEGVLWEEDHTDEKRGEIKAQKEEVLTSE